jgi:hypothetical protein
MYKIVCVVVLLLGTIGLIASDSGAVRNTPYPYPSIMATVRQTGQTSSIPTTTIFTPKQDGLYRASAYMTMTTPGTDQSLWVLNFNWTDNAGEETTFLSYAYVNQKPPHAYALSSAADSPTGLTFMALAGVPVTFSVVNGTGGVYVPSS